MFSYLKNVGPGAIVAAAFVGPGTVTVCTLAGARFGYALLWTLVLATIATIVLQEMTSRLGVISQKGLGETLSVALAASPFRWPMFVLILLAIYAGNAAFEAGNVSGASLGISAIVGSHRFAYPGAVLAVSLIAGSLLWFGRYKQLEKILLSLVLLMALAFAATFFVVKPNVIELIQGLVVPSFPTDSLTTVVALIGTTIVPYNLFLHASAAKSRWNSERDLPGARIDTAVSISIGGLVTILIASTAGASLFGLGIEIDGADDMARQFEPLFGVSSKYLLGIGFLAAGLSSAITAPLATAYVVTEILPIRGGDASLSFRLVALSVVCVGVALALTGIQPIRIIFLAQVANGLLLPIVTGFLLFAVNRREFLGRHTNGRWANVLGGAIFLFSTALGLAILIRVLGNIGQGL